MRLLTFSAISALALTAAACAPHVKPTERTSLDCPDRQGRLTLTSRAANGKTCVYRSDDVDVTLELIPVSGSPDATLKTIEDQLVGPAQAAPAPAAPANTPNAAPATSGDAAKAAQDAAHDAGNPGSKDEDWDSDDHDGKAAVVTRGDAAKVRLPGIHVDAQGDRAKVDVFGVHIDANGDNEAEIHIQHDVRLPGEAFSRERRGLRASLIVRRDNLPGGYRAVGYEASGPKVGPLTVAIVRARGDLDEGDHISHDVQRLVRKNGV